MERRYYYPYPQEERRVPTFCLCLLTGLMIILTVAIMPMVIYDINLADLPAMLRNAVKDYHVTLAFEEFKHDHGKVYQTKEEEVNRRAVFAENYRRIVEFNSEKHNFELGINQFADLTQEEFRRLHLSNPEPVDLSSIDYSRSVTDDSADEPVDWVEKGKVSPIRDQGNCGSCWTFASIAATESLHAIKENLNTPLSFSEQQLVDCCRTPLSQGCNGGERWQAFAYITQEGIAARDDYPYMARNGVCKQDSVKKVMKLNEYKNITRGNSIELAEHVRLRPVSIGVNASPFVFLYYKSGILDSGCPSNEINHAVVAVGVGEKDGMKFWRVRNSWGVKWGDKGYIYIKREVENGPGQCAIAMKGCMPKYPGEA